MGTMGIQAIILIVLIGVLGLYNVRSLENKISGIAVLLSGIGVFLVILLTQILQKLDQLLLALK